MAKAQAQGDKVTAELATIARDVLQIPTLGNPELSTGWTSTRFPYGACATRSGWPTRRAPRRRGSKRSTVRLGGLRLAQRLKQKGGIEMENGDKVLEQVLAVRATGRTNMLDVTAVQRIAYEMDFYELVCFIEDDRRAYVTLIMTGKAPAVKPAPEMSYPVSKEKCGRCPSCSLVTQTITGAPIGREYYQCLSGAEADCRGE